MKVSYWLLARCAMVGVFSSGAIAADGTITFEGTISEATCEISGGDDTTPDQGPDFTVTLPKVNVVTLNEATAGTGDTPFHIKLSGSNCTNGKIANVVFEKAASTTIESVYGGLVNNVAASAGGAENVLVRIKNTADNSNTLNLNNANTSHQPVLIASNAATFSYSAYYYALNAAATSGDVKAELVYSISYE